VLKLNEIYCGDCLEVMKDIDDNSIDAIITDPPYGTTACKWDSVIPFDLMWEQLKRIVKDNGAIVLFGSEPFSSYLRISNIDEYKYDWVFEKTRPSNPALAKKRPLNYIEYIHIFYPKMPTYNPQMIRGKKNHGQGKGIRRRKNESNLPTSTKSYMNNPSSNMKYPKNLLKFDRGTIQIHPTQKPVLLMEYLIKTYTNEDETVLDFAVGSGTTAVACINTKRNFIGIDTSEEYVDISNKRIKDLGD
jgi:DNA modification methylase